MILILVIYCFNRFRSILSIMTIGINCIHPLIMIICLFLIKIDRFNSFRAFSFMLTTIYCPLWMLVCLMLISIYGFNASWCCMNVSIIAISSIYGSDALRAFPFLILISVYYFTSSIERSSWVFISINSLNTGDSAYNWSDFFRRYIGNMMSIFLTNTTCNRVTNCRLRQLGSLITQSVQMIAIFFSIK